jgi:hypothetical protein
VRSPFQVILSWICTTSCALPCATRQAPASINPATQCCDAYRSCSASLCIGLLQLPPWNMAPPPPPAPQVTRSNCTIASKDETSRAAKTMGRMSVNRPSIGVMFHVLESCDQPPYGPWARCRGGPAHSLSECALTSVSRVPCVRFIHDVTACYSYVTDISHSSFPSLTFLVHRTHSSFISDLLNDTLNSSSYMAYNM